jgi:hypothetical protein
MNHLHESTSASIPNTHKSKSPTPSVPSENNGNKSVIPPCGTTKCHPYTRSQKQETKEKVCTMEERWRVHESIVDKIRKQQIRKSPEQITADLKSHQLYMKELQRRKAEKLARKIIKPQRKTKVQDLRMALCRIERIVGKQKEMLNCSCEIIKRQVELLQSTIAEVKRQSEIKGEIDEEINQLCGEIKRLQQQ